MFFGRDITALVTVDFATAALEAPMPYRGTTEALVRGDFHTT